MCFKAGPAKNVRYIYVSYLVLVVRNLSRHLKVFSQNTFCSSQKTDSNPNKAQDRERNERRLVPPLQYELDPGILHLADQSLSFLAYCSSIAVLHLGYYELK